jgi:hypothetical protein
MRMRNGGPGLILCLILGLLFDGNVPFKNERDLMVLRKRFQDDRGLLDSCS